MRLKLSRIAEALNARLVGADPGLEVGNYSIDTRTLESGALFFALVGPNHDAHRFVPDAFRRGAAAAVVHAEVPGAPGPLVRVHDTTRALQDLAAHVRHSLSAQIVAITGSAGKTTTRAMAEQVAGCLGPAIGSPGNLNNLYGLPLALLRLEPHHRTAVLEAGMSRPGELARLAQISDPDLAVLLNVGPVHIEFFETLEKIAAAKEELFTGMRSNTTAVMNADDARVMAIAGRFARRGGRVLSFGIEREAELRASRIQQDEHGGRARVSFCGQSADLKLRFFGTHFLANALAALGVGLALGAPLASLCRALAGLEPLERRGQLVRLPGGGRLIDDCYNSNPTALAEALRALLQVARRGRRVVVAGDMLELGSLEEDAHRAAGERIARSGAEVFFGVGPRMLGAIEAARAAGHPSARHFSSAEEAAEAIAGEIKTGDSILVKGSRGVHLEKVVEALLRVQAHG
ncbi:MAG: UDP-N-acetylmuramoyl-tripeptide--D-alanyl-D-alanine ligase [Acidobacteriota bacterium]